MIHQLVKFAAVGLSALLVHFALVAWVLVPTGCAPLMANLYAFILAFVVSYCGHRALTFKARQLPHRRTLPRYAVVAGVSFALNESLYFALLHNSTLDYRSALLIVLLTVAALTFVLGRCWAFCGGKLT